MKSNILYTLLLFCIFSCQQKNESTNTLEKELDILRKNAVEYAGKYLEKEKEYESFSKAEKAQYGLEISVIYSKAPINIEYDEYLDFSIEYYKKSNMLKHLTYSYFYKGLLYKDKRIYKPAIQNLLKAKEIAEKHKFNLALVRIYFQLSQLASFQNEKEKAISYTLESIKYAEILGDKELEAHSYLILRRNYTSAMLDEEALEAALKALSLTQDSILKGEALTDIGRSYHFLSEFDSAKHYIYESLPYPYSTDTELSVRYMFLVDVYSELNETDSVSKYLWAALNEPMDIYYQGVAYEKMIEVSTYKNENENVKRFASLLKTANDSILKLETQSNIDVLEQIHELDKEKIHIKTQRLYLGISLLILLLIALFIIWKLHKRDSTQKKEVHNYKAELKEKAQLLYQHHNKLEKRQELILQDLSDEMRRTKEKYAVKRAKSNFQERMEVDRKIYKEVLHLEDEKAFTIKMNHLLNNLPDKLSEAYPDITHKDILWCCLFLLQISTYDMCLILEYKQTSLYKFKQRLIKKLGFGSAKEFEAMLYNMMKK